MVLATRNPASVINLKNTSSLECRIFIAIATVTCDDSEATLRRVLTNAGLCVSVRTPR